MHALQLKGSPVLIASRLRREMRPAMACMKARRARLGMASFSIRKSAACPKVKRLSSASIILIVAMNG